MKKILFKTSLLAALVVVILYICNSLYIPIALYEDNPNYSVTKFDYVPCCIDVCNFGNSQAVDAFAAYDGIQDKVCFDFALSAQTLSYDYRIMQQYADNINESATVFITLSYFSFQVDEQNEANFDSKNERYYHFLEPLYIKNFTLKEYCFFKTFPVLWHSPVRIMQSIQTYNDAKKQKNGSEKDFVELAENAYNGRKLLDENNKLIVVDSEYNALVDMVAFCNLRGYKPVVIITPYREEYNTLFEKDFYKQFYTVVTEICNETGAQFCDYSHDERFSNNDSYFLDAYHLSSEGSRAFLEVIDQEIIGY